MNRGIEALVEAFDVRLQMGLTGAPSDERVQDIGVDTHMFERDPDIRILVLTHGIDVLPEGTFE